MQIAIDTVLRWVVAPILILLVTYVGAKILRLLVIKASERAGLDMYLSRFLAKCSSTTTIIFGVITALGTMGVDVSALVAGLGLTGFALGFALKDTISNLMAGILLLLYKPFKISDRIQVQSFEGRVTSIDLRYTTLKAEREYILVPNSTLFTNPIKLLKRTAS